MSADDFSYAIEQDLLEGKPTRRPPSSKTTGSQRLARTPQNSIGQLLGETGYCEPKYINQLDEGRQVMSLVERAKALKRQQQLSKDWLVDAGRHLESLILPATPTQITARIDALLEHFYSPNLTEDSRGLLLVDWGRLLGEFPFWAIDAACLAYLRKPGRKRPVPSDILELMPYEVARAREAAAHCRELAA